MAVTSDTVQTYGVVGRREDLTDVIHDVTPTDTPFMSAIEKGSCNNTYHEWQTDALAAATGDNKVIEGDNPANDAITATVRLGNYTQLMDKVIQVSSTQRAANNAGRGDELSYQVMKSSKELKRDIETRITGNYASVAGNASTARELAGYEAWIQTNDSRGSGGANTAFSGGIQAAATDGTQRVFTETLLKDVLQLCWENGGDPSMIMVGAFNKKQLSQFAGIADQVRDTGSKRATIVGAADVYVSDFGQYNIVANRFSRTRTALVVDPSMWKLCYYQRFKTEDL
ncbi:MAG: hypothetical protein RIR00_2629, partial [Pseudomonadota bacterium]